MNKQITAGFLARPWEGVSMEARHEVWVVYEDLNQREGSGDMSETNFMSLTGCPKSLADKMP
jgi:hypothetical protein